MEAIAKSACYLPVVVLVTLVLKWAYLRLFQPVAKLPGPWYSNFTDAVVRYQMVRGNKNEYVDNLHKRYGPIVRLSPSEVSLRDPSVTRKVYNVKNEFLKAEFYDKIAGNLVNVFNTRDIWIHRRFRRLLSTAMAETSIMKYYPVVDSKTRMAIERMKEEMRQRKAVASELSFGESFRTLETGQKNQYLRDLEFVAKATGIRVTFPFLLKLGRYINIPVISGALAHRQRVYGYAEQSVARHYRLVEEKGEDYKPTLLSKLYEAGEGGMSKDEVQANAMSYVVAGSDTTANTLTYLVWEVCRHPEVKEKLLQELQGLPGSYRYEDIKTLYYLGLVIEEALRLYPAAPAGLERDVPPGGAEFLGYYIPAGCTVSIGAWSMHRQPSVFEEPEKFDPSRWESPTRDMKDSFVPFGGGSRVCLGVNLARMELRLATTRFFKAFPDAEVSSAEGFCEADMEPEMFFLLSPKSKRCLIEV